MKIFTKNCFYALLLNLFVIFTAQAQTWSGSVSTDWNNNANWVGGAKPTTSGDVVINSGGNQPVIMGGTTAVARSIELYTGANLTIQASGSLSINGSIYSAIVVLGTMTNNGTLNIGNTSNIAEHGIYITNTGSFTNGSTGVINLDNIQLESIYNQGLFNNNFTINIGANTTTGIGSGLRISGGSGIFNNNTGSSLVIEKCYSGIQCEVSSTFSNAGTVSIGVNTSCTFGLTVNGNVNNNAGGVITIDNVSATEKVVLNNSGGSITNAGTMNLKKGNYGIWNQSNFTNSSSGNIYIDGSANTGLYHDNGTFSNSGKITVGQNSSVGVGGINSRSTFNNNTGAEINVLQATNSGIWVLNSVFTNNSLIKISAVCDYGFSNYGTINNNSAGVISIDGTTYSGFYNTGIALNNNGKITVGAVSGTFTNSGFVNLSSVVNSACAQLRVMIGLFNNVASKTISNSGLVEISGQLFNGGTFTNNGVLKYGTKTGTGAFTSNTNSSLIVNNTPIPIFTYGGTYDGTVNGIFSNATATTSAGTFTAPNTFDPLGSLPAGTNTLYAKITPQGGACNFVVPFTYVITPKPEINVKGNSISITSGDITPSSSDSTDFGILYAGVTNTNTFRIENIGNATLTLGSNPVSISGANASDFAIIQPSATSIASGGFLDFKITFNATTVGVKEATISIVNDDSNENPYTFKIRGSFQFIAGDFVGSVKIKDGTQASGRVLTSDANGVASWQTPATGLPTASQAGEMVYYNGSNWVKLASGQNGQSLYFCDGAPHWGPCPPCTVLGTNTPTTTVDYLPSSNATIGNTFTACKTGSLTSISFQMDTNGINGGNNNTGTHTVKFGLGASPMTQTLANGLATVGTISTVAGSGGTVTLTLANPIQVTAGTVYAFGITITGSGLFSIDRGENDMTGGDYFEVVNSVFNAYPFDLGFSVVIN